MMGNVANNLENFETPRRELRDSCEVDFLLFMFKQETVSRVPGEGDTACLPGDFLSNFHS